MKRQTNPKPRVAYRNQAPKSIADILAVAAKRPDLKAQFDRYAAFPHWAEIVGPEIAKVAFPEKIIRKRILVIRVLDSAWAQELSLQRESLLEKVAAFEKGAQIEEIRFLTGNPRQFAARGRGSEPTEIS